MTGPISSQNLERRILSSFCQSRGAYEDTISELGHSYKDALSPIAQIVAKLLEDYYGADGGAGSCPVNVLSDRAAKAFEGTKHSKAIAEYCGSLDPTCSVPNVLLDIRRGRKRHLGDRLAALLANHAESDEIDGLAREYSEIVLSPTEEGGVNGRDDDGLSVHRAPSVVELVQSKFRSEGTVSFGIPRLDDACDGGARPGHSILIYARPEVGKTLLTLHFVSHWLGLGKRVLYAGNEDPISDILLRVVGRMCRKKKEEILRHPDKADELVRQRGYNGLVAASLAPGTISALDKLVEEHKPDILVVDQVRNLDMKDDNRVTTLEKAGIGVRNLAKKRGIIVASVTQAGESAEGKPYLGLGDIDFSKTGLPGAIDLAIGMGGTTDDLRFGVRGISLPKNKLGGQHAEFRVNVDIETGYVSQA